MNVWTSVIFILFIYLFFFHFRNAKKSIYDVRSGSSVQNFPSSKIKSEVTRTVAHSDVALKKKEQQLNHQQPFVPSLPPSRQDLNTSGCKLPVKEEKVAASYMQTRVATDISRSSEQKQASVLSKHREGNHDLTLQGSSRVLTNKHENNSPVPLLSNSSSKCVMKPPGNSTSACSVPYSDNKAALGISATQKSDKEIDGGKYFDEMKELIQKKTKLQKEIKSLESKRSLLQEHRNSILESHKDDRKGLDDLLKENSMLCKEVQSQLSKRCDIIQKMNVSLSKFWKKSGFGEISSSSLGEEKSHKISTEADHKIGNVPSKLNKESRKSQEKNYQSQDSPSSSYRSHQLPRNSSKNVSSPKHTRKRSRSPEGSVIRPSSPSSTKHIDSATLNVIGKHWARSHIMGTLKKFKKDLFAEVNVYNPSDIKKALERKAPSHNEAVEKEDTSSPMQSLKHHPDRDSSQDLKKNKSDPKCDTGTSEMDATSSNSQGPVQGPVDSKKTSPEVDHKGKSIKEKLKPEVHYRFMDIGDHWCKMCDEVFETLPMYCNHLLTSSHLSKLKVC